MAKLFVQGLTTFFYDGMDHIELSLKFHKFWDSR
jgi:hypothetical protein